MFFRSSIVVLAGSALAMSALASSSEGDRALDTGGVQNLCGILAFDSRDTFQTTIEDLRLQEEKEGSIDYAYQSLDEFEDALGFYSLRRTLDDLEEEREELTPEEDHVADDYLATVTNPDYKVVIGSSGYVLTADITYEYPGIHACELINKDLSRYEVKEHVNDPEKGNGGRRKLQVDPCDGWRSCTAYTIYNNGQRRIKGRIWIQNYPFYATAGTRTKHYRLKNNGGWTKERADEIWCAAGITVTDLNCAVQGTGSFGDSRNNRKTVQETRSWWNQITRAHAMVGLHGAEDNGAICERGLDLFNCNDDTLNCDPTPSPTPAPVAAPTPGPSCMSGWTGIETPGDGRGAPPTVKAVEEVEVGETIMGLDEDMNQALCTVEAIGYFGVGPVFGNYTDDHYILKSDKTVSEHGTNGEELVTGKYAMLTSCPVGRDESGVGFTPLDSDFFGSHEETVSWADYVLTHKSLLSLVRASGPFWFSPSTYTSMEAVGQYTPALYSTMLKCAKDPTDCNEFEQAARMLVALSLTPEAKELAYSFFPNLGETGVVGSVSAVLMSRK